VSKPSGQTLALAALLALASAGLWLMDGWIARQGWAAWDGRKWAVAAEGWPLVVQAWPVAMAASTALLVALWPILAWSARRQAEADLAGRMAVLDQRGQAIEQGRQALERDRQEAQARLDARRQELDAIHTRKLAEAENRILDVQTAFGTALAEATEEANQARAEVAEAKAQLETAERGRKNAAWVAARLKNKIAHNAP